MSIYAKKRKKALLLHYAGNEVFKIYETLNLAADESNYDTTKKALEDYFNPKKNKEFKRYEFRNIKQGQNETMTNLAQDCVKKQRTVNLWIKTVKLKARLSKLFFTETENKMFGG